MERDFQTDLATNQVSSVWLFCTGNSVTVHHRVPRSLFFNLQKSADRIVCDPKLFKSMSSDDALCKKSRLTTRNYSVVGETKEALKSFVNSGLLCPFYHFTSGTTDSRLSQNIAMASVSIVFSSIHLEFEIWTNIYLLQNEIRVEINIRTQVLSHYTRRIRKFMKHGFNYQAWQLLISFPVKRCCNQG